MHTSNRGLQTSRSSWTPFAFIAGLSWLVLIAGCFNPSYPENLPCDPEDGWCPSGQMCNSANICVPDTGEPQPDASPFDAPPPPVIVGIDIGDDLTMNVDDTAQFSVALVYSDDSTVPVDPSELVIWRSSNNAIVRIDFNGLATADAPGQVSITGRYDGLVDVAEVVVNAP